MTCGAPLFFVLIVFSGLNWLLEIFKWKYLVSTFQRISFLNATAQSLGSLTASIFTPNRVGEYGAKALYFSKKNTKQVVLLNFIGNSFQMLVTTIFGVLGIYFYFINANKTTFFDYYVVNLKSFGLFVFLFGILVFSFRNYHFFGISITKILKKISRYSIDFYFKILVFSTLRYVVFFLQFLYLILVFEVNISFDVALAIIATMYLMVSIIPTIPFIDVPVKGSVALILFNVAAAEEWKIAAVVVVMWFFNLVLPMLGGSFFVWHYNPFKR